MKNIIKKESLRTAICLMLVLVMAVTILPENVQAEQPFLTELIRMLITREK